MANALDVANYIIRTTRNVDNLKLQKLLFYVQAVSLVKFNKKAFEEKIEAWDYGPVIRRVYDTYKVHGVDDIEKPINGSPDTLNEDVIVSADLVIEYYGKKSGLELMKETHSEKPWLDAYKLGQNTEIKPDSIRKYYKKIYSFT